MFTLFPLYSISISVSSLRLVVERTDNFTLLSLYPSVFVAILSYFAFFAAAVIHWGNSSPLLMSSSFSFILICVHVQSIQSMDYCWLTVSGLNIYLNCSSNRHRALTSNGESIVRLSVDVRTSGTAEELLLTINDPWCFMAAMRMFRICCFSSRQLNYNSSILIVRKRKRAPKKDWWCYAIKGVREPRPLPIFTKDLLWTKTKLVSFQKLFICIMFMIRVSLYPRSRVYHS